MNIEPLKSSYVEARTARREYTASVRKLKRERLERAEGNLARARLVKTAIEREDEALKKAYSAIERGQQVFNLNTVLRTVGLFDGTFMPKIAIVRADSERVKFQSMSGNRHEFAGARKNEGFHIRSKHTTFSNALFGQKITFDWRSSNNVPAIWQYEAIVPFVPPRLRPEKLEEYFIMWEPTWKRVPPAPDPFLLKPLGNGFFAVVAHWDMTPLEQSILEGRIA